MPQGGAITLADFHPDEMLRVSCEKRSRAGQLRISTLTERYGGTTCLPEVLRNIADRPRQASMTDPYGAICPGLRARTRGGRAVLE
jgi:hypothetical protein